MASTLPRSVTSPVIATSGRTAIPLSAETIEVYRREGSLWVVSSTHGAETDARPEPFGAVPFDLGALFRKPAKPTT